jgi:hypothetical protein
MEKYHGNTVEYWKQNAKEDYIKTPISVLKYITVLEEQAEQLRKHAVGGQVCSFYMSGMDTSGKCNNCGKNQWEH